MIGERLADLRNSRGMTQEELAKVLNLTKHNISAYECGRNEAPDSVKTAIAIHFNVSVDYLLGLTDQPNPYERAGSRFPADKKPPAEIQELLQCLSRVLTFAASMDSDFVTDEIRRFAGKTASENKKTCTNSNQKNK
ncbi:MAG: helix-turn-helix transcriptional regulator [Lachnospiraceae bacterium]|jgi:transcriptional regulator with XRE-family HTH domain|nr:helix-turn-helix transcriptional regulator [Lachnospiraceae bacterium]